jgi:tetratricopeptide (TPR) repeat protein
VLASLYSYILWKEKRGGRYYVFSLLLYSAGLLTKETGLVLPLLIAAYEFVFSDTLSFENCKRVARALIPFAVITVVYCAVIKLIYGDVFGLFGKPKPRGIPPRSFLSNFLTQSAISFFYLHLFFFPFRLCLEHAFPVILRFSDWVGALSVFAVAFAIGGALFLRKRLPLVSFAILWYFIWLVPQFYARLNLPAAEHHAYPAFFAVYIILAFFLSRPLPGCTGQYCCPNGLIGKTGRMCFIFVFGLFSLLTIARCMEWRNEYTFWKSTLRINPHSGIALGSIAVDLINRGHIDEGFRYLEQSVASARLTSTRVTSLLNLIYYNAFLGRTETAERLLAENRQLILKNHPFGYYKNSAFVQEQSGHPQEALEALLAAHRIIPEDESVNGFLGWWYLEHGSDLDKAEVFFRASLRIDPENHLNRLGLAKVLQQKGAYQDAVQEYVRAIEAAPEKYEYYYAAGLIYSMNLHRREAEWYFQKCIALAPTFAPAYYNLCIFYLSLEEPNYFRARQYCDKARELGYTVDEKIENLIQRKAR